MEKIFKAVPDQYKLENDQQGVIESLFYNVTNKDDSCYEKHLNVYLPYGYNKSDPERMYDVLYLMHGGGEDENLLLGGPGQNRELKNILDNMIARDEVKPLIVVTPTFNKVKNSLRNDPVRSKVEQLNHPLPIVETQFFYDELIHDLVPFVESKFHTYLKEVTLAEIKASRDHRAFGGFSMGSVTTWYVFIHCLDYFKYFLPLSGECWALSQKAEGKMAEETAQLLAEAAKNAGYSADDYYIFCASGKKDIAYPNMKPQIDAMIKLKDSFMAAPDFKAGNFYFIDCEDGEHSWFWINQYIFNIVPDLFL